MHLRPGRSPFHVPSRPSIIDRGHWSAAGLRSAWLPGVNANRAFPSTQLANAAVPAEYLNGTLNSGSGVATDAAFATQKMGRGIYTAGSGLGDTGMWWREVTDLWTPFDAGGHAPITIAMYMEFPSGWDIPLTGISNASTTQGAPRIGIHSSVRPIIEIRLVSGTEVRLDPDTDAPSNTPIIVIATTRSATDHEMQTMYLHSGYYAKRTSSTDTGAATANANRECIGGRFGGGSITGGAAAHVYGMWVWQRGFSSDEMLAFIQGGPFQMLRPSSIIPLLEPSAGSIGDLAVTLDDDAVSATASVPIVGDVAAALDGDTVAATATVAITGNLAATLDADAVVATGTVAVSGELAVTLGDDAVSATGYPGSAVVGVVGETPIVLDDDVVTATASVDVFGDLAVMLDSDVVAAFAVSGTNGPFARRRMLVLNG